MVLLRSINVFSQTLVLNENSDTTICFSINQGKYLLKQVYKLKECDTLYSICNQQLLLSDSVIANQKINIDSYKKIVSNQYILISSKDAEIDMLDEKIKEEKKNVRKQKVYRWLTFGVSVCVTTLMAYLLVVK